MNRTQFWNQKILTWERDKYEKSSGLDVNQSVKERMRVASRMLQHFKNVDCIVELGCGSARLLPEIKALGIKKYIGIDLSSTALDVAKERAKELKIEERCSFLCTDILTLPHLKADLCFSLGLLDWLTLEEMKLIPKRIETPYYFHSFSEKRPTWQQWLHKIYVFMLYAYRTGSYRPRYFSTVELTNIFNVQRASMKFYRSKTLSFSTFLYSLPSDANIK